MPKTADIATPNSVALHGGAWCLMPGRVNGWIATPNSVALHGGKKALDEHYEWCKIATPNSVALHGGLVSVHVALLPSWGSRRPTASPFIEAWPVRREPTGEG